MSKYTEMIEHVHMPENMHDQLRDSLVEQRKAKQRKTTLWKRYVAAAVVAFCLMGTTATVYAAYHFQWLDLFFQRNGKETSVEKEYIKKSSVENPGTVDSGRYQMRVQNHLYSKEQQMGMIVCSFKILTNIDVYLRAYDVDKKEDVILTKDKVIQGKKQVKQYDKGEKIPLDFLIQPSAISFYEVYYSNEMAADGGYLIGIRYSLGTEKKKKDSTEMSLQIGNLTVNLPETKSVETIRFLSDNETKKSILVSPIGMKIFVKGKGNPKIDTLDDKIFNNINFVMKNGTQNIRDLETGTSTSSVDNEKKSGYTWRTEKMFAKLINLSDIQYIEWNGCQYREEK